VKSKAQAVRKGAERRRSPRRPILDSFSIAVVAPSLGIHKLRVLDVSDHGLGFALDLGPDLAVSQAPQVGSPLEIDFYLNQTLGIRLETLVKRIDGKKGNRLVGVELVQRRDPRNKAFKNFVELVDSLSPLFSEP
jgi:hypothetical protein